MSCISYIQTDNIIYIYIIYIYNVVAGPDIGLMRICLATFDTSSLDLQWPGQGGRREQEIQGRMATGLTAGFHAQSFRRFERQRQIYMGKVLKSPCFFLMT